MKTAETPEDFISFLNKQKKKLKNPDNEFFSPPNLNSYKSRRGGISLQNDNQEINLENRQTLISFLEKLKEDRNSYFKIINQANK